MTSTPLNLTLLNDGVASQRVMLPQTTPFHLNAVAGNRYLITQGSQDKALGPKQLKFSRKGRNLEIYGAEDEQPQLIILDYFAQPGDVLGVDASGELHTYVSASDAGLNAAAFADNQQAVMMMSEASGGPLAAFYPADNYGFLRAASAFAGLLALGGGILAMQNQHGGSDKGPPAPPSIIQGHDDFGTVTGVLQSGAVTNNASPDISGQGSQPGHLVHIYANGMMQGSAMVGEDGSWTFSLSGLAEGRHHLTATESSANGKMSAESAHFELHVDLTPPAVALDGITDNVGTLTGLIPSGGLTNDSAPQLSGQSEPGARVEITVDGRVVGSTVADEAGNWRFTLPSQADGGHRISVTATDAVGNTSAATADYLIVVDTIAPVARISDALDNVAGGLEDGASVANGGLTNDNRPVLRGTAEAGSLVMIYDGSTAIGSFTATGDAWEFPFTDALSDGEHTFSIVVTDPAGNSTTSASYVLNVDTIAPEAVITGVLDNVAGGTESGGNIASGGLTNDSQPVLRGVAEAGSLVVIFDGLTAIASFTATSDVWEFQLAAALSEGEHTLKIQVTDPAGNATLSDPYLIHVDTQVARPVIASVTDAVTGGVEGAIANDGTGLTNDGRPVLAGTAEAGSLVTIYDGATAIGSVRADATGAWRWQHPAGQQFADGAHVLTVRAVDPAGNVSVASQGFTLSVDTQVARPVIASVTDAVTGGVEGAIANDGTGLTNDGRPVLAGTAESGSLVTIYDGATAIGSVRADTTGAWRWQHPAGERFADGAHVLTVRAVDPAGNVSVASGSFTLSVDTQVARPVIASVTDAVTGGVEGAIANDGTGLTNDGRPVLAGTAEAGSLVTIYDGATAIGSVRADTTGAWRWQHPAGERFADGAHVLTVRAVDPAGNVSVASQGFTLSVDTQVARPVIASVTDAVTGGVEGAIANDGTGLTNDGRPVLAGTAESGSLVTIYDGATAIGSVLAHATTGAWRWQHPAGQQFADGAHVLTVQVLDKAGNLSSASESFVINVDSLAPVAPEITVGTDDVGALTESILKGRITDDTTPTFSGKAEPNSLVFLFDNDVLLGSFNADDSGDWRWELPELLPGMHNLTAYSVDAAGNRSALSEGYDFKVGTVWDFNDGTFDGWRILGDHRNPGNTFTRPTAGGGYQLEFITIGGGTYGGDIMSREINVVVGETYDFNFILSRITSYALINPAQLALMVDGVAVSAYYTVQDSPQKVEGSWMATRTGTVTLAINNRVSTGSGNDFWIDDIAIALHKPAEPSAGPTALLLSPEIDLPVENSHFIDMTQQAMSSIDLSIHDVLTQGATDLFINDGKVQLMVSGDEGRQLILSDLLPDGSDNGDWTNVGNVRVAGVEYHVYHHSGYDAELLVSLAIQTTLDNH
ncbi:Ig-like domain-containing protein [Pantoea endophytica]